MAKKYTDANRKSPPYPANEIEYRGTTLRGNDTNLWISKPCINGIYRWVKKTGISKKDSSKKGSLKKGSSKKGSFKKSSSKKGSLKKYMDPNRKSPPYPANEIGYRGTTLRGNDTNLWISKPCINGIYRWVKKTGTSKKGSSKKGSLKGSFKKSSFKKRSSKKGSLKKGSSKKGSSKKGSLKKGSLKKGSLQKEIH
jgi:hypothetical protein